MTDRPRKTPAELRALADQCRKDATASRQRMPKTREADKPMMAARIHRLEQLASELEQSAARAEERAA